MGVMRVSTHVDLAYRNLGHEILMLGETRSDRTGVGTIGVFGATLKLDLRDGFPLLTTKKVNFENIVKELLWFLRGDTNIKTLGCHIWDEWADKDGNVGPVYGKQWVAWEREYFSPPSIFDESGSIGDRDVVFINQIKRLIDDLKRNPTSRRHLVSAWNVADLGRMALPPCHVMFQCYVAEGKYLDLQMYQRSADLALGVPYNIASYALLLSLLAKECGLEPRYYSHVFGDVHIYLNHVEKFKEQLQRPSRHMPILRLADKSFWSFVKDSDVNDFLLEGYDPHPFIKYEIAV